MTIHEDPVPPPVRWPPIRRGHLAVAGAGVTGTAGSVLAILRMTGASPADPGDVPVRGCAIAVIGLIICCVVVYGVSLLKHIVTQREQTKRVQIIADHCVKSPIAESLRALQNGPSRRDVDQAAAGDLARQPSTPALRSNHR